MHSQLWFLTDGVRLVSVFLERQSAEDELRKYQDDPDFNYYEYYAVDIDELEDYPDEYELALKEGLLD